MECVFVGVGEAFDEYLGNTSILVRAGRATALLDCGFTAAHAFWKLSDDPLGLDVVWISHFHGDHYFGLPALLVRSIEENRTKDLVVLGMAGIRAKVLALMDLAYPGTLAKAGFNIGFIELSPSEHIEIKGIRFSCAEIGHSRPCLAVRLDFQGRSLFYSGDGRPTDQSLDLARGCGLVVHEAFGLEPDTPGHGTVDGCLEFARRAEAKALALVHVQRQVRRERGPEIRARLASAEGFRAFLAEPGQRFEL
ncbi:MAG: ribonuclease Z [Desulfovibrionaceae bacterium]|nr:ribonuclease Z [Desulfovibrionaceae bacterium]